MQSLLAEDNDAAIAAGVNLMLLPSTTAAICQLSALSPVGRCRTFDSSADGYGRGEGVAVAMLGPVTGTSSGTHAVIHGSAVNQDGRSSGLTAPNGPSQSALVRRALMQASARPADVAVVSTHGTGTPLGDPIEVGALGQALIAKGGAAGPDRSAPLAMVSNKSCYGHTEGAAGLSGALMALACAGQCALPPVMHLRQWNVHVAAALSEWRMCHGSCAAVPMQPAGRHSANKSHLSMIC